MRLGTEFDSWAHGMGLTPFGTAEREPHSENVLDLLGKRVKRAYIAHQLVMSFEETKKLLRGGDEQQPIRLTDSAELEVRQHIEEHNPAVQLRFNPNNGNGNEFSVWFEQDSSGIVRDMHVIQTVGGELGASHVTDESYLTTSFSEIRNTFGTIRGILQEAHRRT